MIKLQDFARDCGVTDRAIQKHLKNHEKQLEGHFQRRGKNGTWLDQTAQEYIRSLMVQQPIVVGDGDAARENDLLKKRISELEARLSEKELLVEMAQRRADALQEKVGQIYALEEGKRTAEREATEARQEAVEARLREETALSKADELQRALDASEARETALRARSLWQRIRNK